MNICFFFHIICLYQRSGLGPITASSEVYRKQYSTMAHALDTTRHQLPLKGIHVPDEEEKYQGKY